MNISKQIRDLFGRGNRRPIKLSGNVVQHARIDEIVHEDLVTKSCHYRDAVQRELAIENEDGEPTPYEPIADLREDLFYSHYTSGDEVRLTDAEEIKPSRKLHQEIMRHYHADENYRKSRALTKNDDLGSMLASMAAQNTLEEELVTTLKEHAEQAEQIAQGENLVEGLSDDLDGAREQAQNEHGQGGVSQATKDRIKDLVNKRNQAMQDLQQQVEQQGSGSLGMDAAAAVGKAAEEAADMADAFGSVPGLDMADHATMQPDEAFALAQRWRDGRLREIAKLIGRLERDFRYQRSNRVVGGRDEPVDVTLGDEIDLVLPDEFVKLHPQLRATFFRDYAEGTLIQYETVGYESAGDGPIIAVIDTSDSMGSKVAGGLTRMDYAAGVTLALMAVAAREKRAFAAIHCDTRVLHKVSARKGRKLTSEEIIKVASVSPAGGTRLDPGVLAAEEIIDTQEDFKSADIVVISDGESGYTSLRAMEMRSDIYDAKQIESWREQYPPEHYTTDRMCERLKAKGVRCHGIAIGTDVTIYLSVLADMTGGAVTSVTEFTKPTKGLGQVVGAIS